MSVSQRVQLLSDKSEELSILAEFIKNPSLIEELSNEVKKLNALTKEEESKLADAKSFIMQHASLKKELDDKRVALEADIARHEKEIKDTYAKHMEEVYRMDAVAKAQKDKEDQQTIIDKRHMAEAKELDKARKAMLDEQEKNLEDVRKTSAENEKAKAANEKEASRLASLRQKLEEKAAKIQEAAAL